MGAASGTLPTQGQGTGEGQPPASGQAPPASGATGGSGFNWGLFPNVPEEQRPLLEPHLKEVQGHVTRLEQQFAPFKPLTDAGYTPQEVQGLMRFAQEFQDNPLELWLKMGQQLQQDKIVHEDLDLDSVTAIAKGEPEPGEPVEGVGGMNGAPDQMPAWAQQMQQELQQMREESQRTAQQRQQQVEDRLLQRQLENARTQLKEAGVVLPENDQDTDRLLVSALIAHQGHTENAVKSLLGFREGNLKGLVNNQTKNKGGEPDMPKGPPPSPERNKPTRGDPFAEARAGALNHFQNVQEASAQEGT